MFYSKQVLLLVEASGSPLGHIGGAHWIPSHAFLPAASMSTTYAAMSKVSKIPTSPPVFAGKQAN